jgi:hypothetical protein
MADSDPEAPQPIRQGSAGYSAGTNQGTTEEMKDKIHSATISMGDNPLARNLADRAASARPDPPPAKPTLLKRSSSTLSFLEEILEESKFVPAFESDAMIAKGDVIPNPFEKTDKNPKRMNSIKEDFEFLYERLCVTGGWNLGEQGIINNLLLETRKIALSHRMSMSQNLSFRENLKVQHNRASAEMKNNYAQCANKMQKEDSWDKIVEACNQIQSQIESKGQRCLQSTTLFVTLYIHALELHDDRLWKYSSGATHLHAIEVGMAVQGTIHHVPRVGKVVEIRPQPNASWVNKRNEGFVKIQWEPCDGYPAQTEDKEYRFFKKPFEDVLAQYSNEEGVTVSVGSIKNLYRLVEKIMRHGNDVGVASIMDVVRASLVCDTNAVMIKLLRKLSEDPRFKIWKVKEGYSHAKDGAWLDVKLIVSLQPPASGDCIKKGAWQNGHKCELQIYHKEMSKARTNMGGHDTYNKCRSLAEAIKSLEVDDTEMDELETRILSVMSKGNPSQVARIGHFFSANNGLSASAMQWLSSGAEGGDLSFLDDYPDISLKDYVEDGNFWHINKEFPGLRCVSKDPFIFLVPNLLTADRCKALMLKAGPHMKQSKAYNPSSGKYEVGEQRTSWDVRFHNTEMKNTQEVFSDVLKMPVTYMEPPKLVRYTKKDGVGEVFNKHDDASSYPNKKNKDGVACCLAPYANRVVTLFVYLNTPESGGETHFPNAKAKEGEEGLKIKPHRGMGVIHFPAYLSTSTYKGPEPGSAIAVGLKVKHKNDFIGEVVSMNSDETVTVKMDEKSIGDQTLPADEWEVLENMHGEPDERAAHAGMAAIDEKFLLSQWCWPGDFDVEKHAYSSENAEGQSAEGEPYVYDGINL